MVVCWEQKKLVGSEVRVREGLVKGHERVTWGSVRPHYQWELHSHKHGGNLKAVPERHAALL